MALILIGTVPSMGFPQERGVDRGQAAGDWPATGIGVCFWRRPATCNCGRTAMRWVSTVMDQRKGGNDAMIATRLLRKSSRPKDALATRATTRAATLLTAGALAAAMLGMPSAQAADPASIANTGTGTVLACASCHGKDGGGQAAFPRLAGINAAYLLKQLGDFDSGSRANAIMQPIAKALSPEDRAAITRYYAAMPIPQAKSAPAPASADARSPGAVLALRGKWSQGVPACVQCHGPGGIGVGDAFPAIAAQPADYIAAQLRAWQAGTRKNDQIELMRHLSAKLSEAEIKAVSEWFSRQPAATAGGVR